MLVMQFEQLATVRLGTKLADEEPKCDTATLHARQLVQTIERLNSVEKASVFAGAIHRRTHLALAASLLALAPKTASLADLNSYLPDGSRLLKSGKLGTSEVQAERLHGLLKAEDSSITIPKFYQPFLVNTLKKECFALKEARKGTPEDEILISELIDRLLLRTARALSEKI
ncbi:hypothetical protein ACWJKU_05865 [Methylocaldum sp. MU1018]